MKLLDWITPLTSSAPAQAPALHLFDVISCGEDPCSVSNTTKHILQYLDSHSLGKLGITCRSALSTVYTYVFKHCDTWQLFYCFTKVSMFGLDDLLSCDKNQLYNLDLDAGFVNAWNVGVMIKRLTILQPTWKRIFSFKVLFDKVNLKAKGVSDLNLMKLFSVAYHRFVQGWTTSEVEIGTIQLFNNTDHDQSIGGGARLFATILSPDYKLGTNLQLETLIKNCLSTFFLGNESWKESRISWMLVMLKTFVPQRQPERIAKLMLVATAPIKKTNKMIQLQDNIDAVPACLKVAKSRYDGLVLCFLNLQKLGGGFSDHDLQSDILNAIFRTPEPWLPENIASFLILCGSRVMNRYLQYCLAKVMANIGTISDGNGAILADDVASQEKFSMLSELWVALFTMQSRFDKSLETLFSQLDTFIKQMPSHLRAPFLDAFWSSIGKELRELQEAEEDGQDQDSWSEYTHKHVMNIIKFLGIRFTVLAFPCSEENVTVEDETEE